MQTTPPTVRASTAYAGVVHPAARNSAQVAISVAMVMPETGLAEVPIRPQMREDTVTNRKPNTTTRTDAMRLLNTPVLAPGTGLKVSRAHSSRTITAEPPRTSVLG